MCMWKWLRLLQYPACITAFCECGGDWGREDGKGCRLDFPKKLNYAVPGVIQVNHNQMQVRMLTRRKEGEAIP